MKITEIKKQMKEYTDMFGQPLLNNSDIDGCKTKRELAEIIDLHHTHIGEVANDAQHSLDRFKRTIGLGNLS